MAGTLTISTLSDGTNSTSSTNCIQGSAKAWVKFNGGNGNTAGVINASFNVSSITLGGTGLYTVNFTTTFADANYSALASATDGAYGALGTSIMYQQGGSYTSSACTFYTRNSSGTGYPPVTISAAFFK